MEYRQPHFFTDLYPHLHAVVTTGSVFFDAGSVFGYHRNAMIEHEFKKNYLTMIENAAKGENWLFKNFSIKRDGVEVDALENGGLSCAVLVSSILYLHNSLLEFLQKPHWINFTHANVIPTVKDMLQSGWQEISDLKIGAVLVWEKLEHEHIGFYMGNDEAVSNDSKGRGFPWKHHYTYNDTRKIDKILWHPELDNG